jgi:hypothetical protein
MLLRIAYVMRHLFAADISQERLLFGVNLLYLGEREYRKKFQVVDLPGVETSFERTGDCRYMMGLCFC